MINPLTPQEALNAAFAKVDEWVEAGVCPACALTVVARQHNCEYNKLADLWATR